MQAKKSICQFFVPKSDTPVVFIGPGINHEIVPFCFSATARLITASPWSYLGTRWCITNFSPLNCDQHYWSRFIMWGDTLHNVRDHTFATFFIQFERLERRTSMSTWWWKETERRKRFTSCFIKTRVLPQDPNILILEVNKLFNVWCQTSKH